MLMFIVLRVLHFSQDIRNRHQELDLNWGQWLSNNEDDEVGVGSQEVCNRQGVLRLEPCCHIYEKTRPGSLLMAAHKPVLG